MKLLKTKLTKDNYLCSEMSAELKFNIFRLPLFVCGLMIVLHLNNWDSPDIFKLSTDFHFFDAIQGIFLSPFAHSTNNHLINNVVPLFLLMSLIRYVFGELSYILFFLFYFLTGLFIWRFASIIETSVPFLHLAHIGDLNWRSGLFPSRPRTLSPIVWLPR